MEGTEPVLKDSCASVSVRLRSVTGLLLLAFACAAPLSAQTQPAPPAVPVSPCPSKAEYREFDFWLGEWDVTDQGRKIATSSIQSIVGGCVVFENYAQADGYTGKSFNFYDGALGRWRQTWVDAYGNVSEFVGEFKDGAMRYEGETHRAGGVKVLRKMILTWLDAGRVRQFSERSTDGGKTWTLAYDYIYTRRK
ncbi:MAG: hypothetical protein ACJ741_04710 [Pyrinomonadaceae bacterium]